MALHLVTGYKGSAHITSADQGMFNAWCVGGDEYVLASGDKFSVTIVGSNTVKINTGSLLMQGRHVISDTPQEVSIANGTINETRHDLIVMRYTKVGTGVESVELRVLTGSPDEGEDPPHETGSILNGATTHDMPLYRVVLEGVNISKVEPLFRMLAPMADIQHGFYKQNLLINGDFQCNQRGGTTWSVGDSVKYSLDMWRIYQIKMQLADNGLKVARYSAGTQGYLTQFVKVDGLAEKYTISLRVDGEVYSFTTAVTTTVSEKAFDRFKISISYISTTKHLKINFCPLLTNYVTVKYIDLFEGSIAYPHVKEDYATALMRCRQYIQKGCYVSPVLAEVAGKYKFAICHDKLNYIEDDDIILESYTWSYIDTEGDPASGTVSTPTSNPTSSEGMFVVSIAGSFAIDSNYPAVKGTYVVSCEHLPNGD